MYAPLKDLSKCHRIKNALADTREGQYITTLANPQDTYMIRNPLTPISKQSFDDRLATHPSNCYKECLAFKEQLSKSTAELR